MRAENLTRESDYGVLSRIGGAANGGSAKPQGERASEDRAHQKQDLEPDLNDQPIDKVARGGAQDGGSAPAASQSQSQGTSQADTRSTGVDNSPVGGGSEDSSQRGKPM